MLTFRPPVSCRYPETPTSSYRSSEVGRAVSETCTVRGCVLRRPHWRSGRPYYRDLAEQTGRLTGHNNDTARGARLITVGERSRDDAPPPGIEPTEATHYNPQHGHLAMQQQWPGNNLLEIPTATLCAEWEYGPGPRRNSPRSDITLVNNGQWAG